MIKRILLLIPTLLGLCTLASSQNYCDVVYLINGGTIKGTVIEQEYPATSVKIQTPDGNIYTYRTEYVKRVAKENCDEPSETKTKLTDRKSFKGYRGFLEIGGGYVFTENEGVLSIQTSHGYQFNPYFFMGAGVGVDRFFNSKATFIPVFGDLRINFTKKPTSPFFDCRIGGSVSNNKGLYANPNFGISVATSEKMAVNFGIGYSMQKNAYRERYYSCYNILGHTRCDDKSLYAAHSLLFRIGVEF